MDIGFFVLILGLVFAFWFFYTAPAPGPEPGGGGGGGGGGGAPSGTGGAPAPAPPGAVRIDYSRFNDKTYANDHTNGSGRATFANNVLTVTMHPGDKDLVTNKPDRMRDEIRFKDKSICLSKGQKGTWGLEVRINGYGDVKWPGFFHIVQIKKDPSSAANGMPMACVSIVDGNVCIYHCGSQKTVISPVTLGEWIQVTFTVDFNSGLVEWTMGGKSGQFKCDTSAATEMYLKNGIYMKVPNPVKKSTSMSFRNGFFARK